MATAQLPWPLAMVSGMVVGALIYLVKNRPQYESEVSFKQKRMSCVGVGAESITHAYLLV